MTILLPFDGTQALLPFDIATTLPVDTLTGIGTSLHLKSNYIQFKDGADNAIMEVTPSYVTIFRDMVLTNKDITGANNIQAGVTSVQPVQ